MLQRNFHHFNYFTNTIPCTHLDNCQWKIFTSSLGQNNHLCKFWTTIILLIKFLIKSSSIGEEDEALRNSATEEGRRVEAATLLLELAPSWPKQQYICFLSEYSEYIWELTSTINNIGNSFPAKLLRSAIKFRNACRKINFSYCKVHPVLKLNFV